VKFKDVREFITFLEGKGELLRIKTLVSSDLEITEIVDRVVKRGGPALLFENVEGYDMPVLVNIYGSSQRTAWALGVETLDELGDRIRKLLGMVQGPPPSLVGKLRTLADLIKMAGYQPKSVRTAPCQEVVLTGPDADLNRIPVLKCWPMDAGRFITLPLVITRNPETGIRNVGMYRMQIYDGQTAGMHWQTHKVGTHHERVALERGQERMEVAVALGGDPATVWTGSAPLPPDLDELVMAGFLREEAVEVVKCKTVDIDVPANSEIILEGYVVPGEVRTEGPFGDHTGYYSMAGEYPVFHLTAITHRQNPIYTTIVVGRPIQEDYYMGKATERLFMPIIRMVLPEIVDINMPAEGVFHNLVIVSIKKEYPGQAQKVMYALWGLGLMMLAKAIVVVDDFVNVQDVSEVAWRVTNNLDASQDIVIVSGPVDDLDHASPTPNLGSKIGIDATAKGSLEGRTREWPPDIAMSDEIKSLVNNKWQEYGL
jgi:4-hydroxy-3-polyprenylbenzoate decarboxylase